MVDIAFLVITWNVVVLIMNNQYCEIDLRERKLRYMIAKVATASTMISLKQ